MDQQKICPAIQISKSNTPNQFTIDLQAVKENYLALMQSGGNHTAIMPMIKAMGYGASDLAMAHFFKTLGVTIFGVAHPDEGVKLRHGGLNKEIFVTHTPLFELEKIVEAGLQTAVSDEETIDSLNRIASAAPNPINVHLSVNTGMNRFGCKPDDALFLAKKILQSKSLKLVGMHTHFASADIPEEDLYTAKQASQFALLCEQVRQEKIPLRYIHAANSSSALRFSLPFCNLMRVGLALYGIYVSASCKTIPLQLAVRLTSRITTIQTLDKGERVSYGGYWRAPVEKTRIAIFPLGYHDGILRSYSNGGYVLIHGQKAPIVGAVCMDNTLVDITKIPKASIGSEVLLFGESTHGSLRPEEFAASGGSIPHELLSQIGQRVPRVFIPPQERETEVRA